MGAAWGVGQLCVKPVGALADHVGLPLALAALSVLLLAGLGCALALPKTRILQAEPATDLASPASV